MSETAILVEGLGKSYRLGAKQARLMTMGELLASFARAPLKNIASAAASLFSSKAPALFWALDGVSFEVKRGEVIGVIGGNGAGKSTLLKILSRVTTPSKGYADIHGRVGSLLEVGTGFHAELTGRENIFLNGSILGMKREEIKAKFEEIVAFAEVEEFLDTPVKRYSSGMYLRLAFSVAAHLEPEILVVDEVLAVGDATFQKKCLGKLQDVATRSERTVLFVSHNMQAVQSLCTRVLHIARGKLVDDGEPRAVIGRYLAGMGSTASVQSWDGNAPGNEEFRLKALQVRSDGSSNGIYSSSKEIEIEMTFEVSSVRRALCVGFDLATPDGATVLRSYQTDLREEDCPQIHVGMNRLVCRIPAGFLNAGQYYIRPKISIHNAYWIVDGDVAVRFEVVLDHGVSPFWNSLGRSSRPGVVSPILQWTAVP